MTNDSLTVGITAQSTDRSMPLLDLATATAERGFGALFVCEHTHMPSDHTSWPPGDEDRFITHLWDPFIALSFVAATTDLAIGTAVALPVQHDPIVLAKEIATLDRLSGGRLTLGFGWGWNREEVANHGYPPAERVAVLAEKLALMKSLWTAGGRRLRRHLSAHDAQLVAPQAVPETPSARPARRSGQRAQLRPHRRLGRRMDPPRLAVARRRDSRRSSTRPGRRGRTPDTTLTASTSPIMQLPETTDRLRQALENARALGVRRVLFVVVEADTSGTLRQLDELAPLLTG